MTSDSANNLLPPTTSTLVLSPKSICTCDVGNTFSRIQNKSNHILEQTQIMQKNFYKSQIPEMYLWFWCINYFVAAVTEVLFTITTFHFVTTFSSRNCHVTLRAQLGITMNFFRTEHFFDLFMFPSLLIFL